MSFAPQAPCILSTIGDCATEIMGKPTAAAPVAVAAPVRNLRRLTFLVVSFVESFVASAATAFSTDIGPSFVVICPGEMQSG